MGLVRKYINHCINESCTCSFFMSGYCLWKTILKHYLALTCKYEVDSLLWGSSPLLYPVLPQVPGKTSYTSSQILGHISSRLFLSFLGSNCFSYKLCQVRSTNKIFEELTSEQAHPALIHKMLTVVDLCLDVTQNLISLSVQGFQLSKLHQ